MQITLIESEIKSAIKLYLEQNISLNPEMDIEVDFIATRGSEGLKASIDVAPKDAPKSIKKTTEPEVNINKETGEITPVEPEAKPSKSLFANLTV